MDLMDPRSLGTLLEWYQHAKREGWLERFFAFWRRKPKVLVLGAMGAGKTQLLESLEADVAEAIPAEVRTVIASTERISLAGNLVDFRDTPGDAYADDARVEEYKKALRHPVAGILNVVAYGYHEHDLGHGERSEALQDDGSTNPQWLEKHRENETKYLAEWTHLIGAGDTTGFIITVCTKADLWWADRGVVREHYTQGEYFAKFRESGSRSPSYTEYASRIGLFFGEGAISPGFDDTVKGQLHRNFCTTLLAALGREARNATH